MAEEYVVLAYPALVGGVEYDAGAIVPIDDTISDEFGTAKTQVNPTYTAALWTSNNPTMTASQFGIELDTGLSKIGDNATAWNSLAYAPTTFDVPSPGDLSSRYSVYESATPVLSDTIVINDASDSFNPKVVTLTALKSALA